MDAMAALGIPGPNMNPQVRNKMFLKLCITFCLVVTLLIYYTDLNHLRVFIFPLVFVGGADYEAHGINGSQVSL